MCQNMIFSSFFVKLMWAKGLTICRSLFRYHLFFTGNCILTDDYEKLLIWFYTPIYGLCNVFNNFLSAHSCKNLHSHSSTFFYVRITSINLSGQSIIKNSFKTWRWKPSHRNWFFEYFSYMWACIKRYHNKKKEILRQLNMKMKWYSHTHCYNILELRSM